MARSHDTHVFVGEQMTCHESIGKMSKRSNAQVESATIDTGQNLVGRARTYCNLNAGCLFANFHELWKHNDGPVGLDRDCESAFSCNGIESVRSERSFDALQCRSKRTSQAERPRCWLHSGRGPYQELIAKELPQTIK